MPNIDHKLYIDVEGINQGYYVYIHKVADTGEVFYVGKGYGERAWETKRRNSLWKKKVESLQSRWIVEIVKDDLGEIEAFELESKLVSYYGGEASTGGSLTNWIPGGEDPGSVSIEIPFDDKGYFEKYFEARKFKSFSREHEEELAKSIENSLLPLNDIFEKFENKADACNDEDLYDFISAFTCELGSVIDTCSEFIRRRVTWKTLCFSLEESFEQLKYEIELYQDNNEIRDKTLASCIDTTISTMENYLGNIDSGNKLEAEEFANKL